MLKELLFSFSKIIIPFFFISFTSIFFIKIIKPKDFIEKIFIFYLINWFQIIISIEIFSLFKIVTALYLNIFYASVGSICLFFSIKKKINFRFDFLNLRNRIIDFYKTLNLNKIVKNILIFWLIIILTVTFFIGTVIPPNNWDSMAYHLARVGFWHQNHSINPYFTRTLRQVEMPFNAELGLLWIIIFTNSDNIVFLIQWFSLILILITLYKFLRLLNFNKKVSFLAIFVFSTLDIVILESNTTQNDLVIASFILLSLYFIVRAMKNTEIVLYHLIFAGLSLGLAIGVKGYSYLFIPGILIFLLIFRRNDSIKIKKLLLFLFFAIIGCSLFAMYNWICNYIIFGNIFSTQQNIELMRVEDPGIKTFISNISRHLASFYQFKDFDFGTLSKLIQKILDFIHYKLALDISSPSTTIANQYFNLNRLVINCDASYFGPIFFFIVLPSFIYNLFFYIYIKLFKRNSIIRNKFMDSLKVFIIPFVFFIGYNYIFVWQPWAGRLMISFALLMMVSFAMFIDFKGFLNNKILFNVSLTIIISILMFFSFTSLFFNEFNTIIPYKQYKSIFSVDYDTRRYFVENPSMEEVKKMVETNLEEDSRLGLLTYDNDWDYVYFGKHFKRKLFYISDIDLNNDIDELFRNKKLDGLIVNIREFQPVYKKIFNTPIIKIDSSNFLQYFKPLNECNLSIDNDEVKINVFGDDPFFEGKTSFNFRNQEVVSLYIYLDSDVETELQIFYKYSNKDYNENDSNTYSIKKGPNYIYDLINNADDLKNIRIDPTNVNNDCKIKNIEIFGLGDFNFEIKNNFLLILNF